MSLSNSRADWTRADWKESFDDPPEDEPQPQYNYRRRYCHWCPGWTLHREIFKGLWCLECGHHARTIGMCGIRLDRCPDSSSRGESA